MDINFQLYKNFYYFVEYSSISQASQKLGATQSALSQSIKNLENMMGKTLLNRTSRGVTLTKDGTSLYDYVLEGVKRFNTAYQYF